VGVGVGLFWGTVKLRERKDIEESVSGKTKNFENSASLRKITRRGASDGSGCRALQNDSGGRAAEEFSSLLWISGKEGVYDRENQNL